VNGWAKTWSFLKELNNYVEYYPSGTTATMKEFGEGSRDLIASTTGWDINPRVLGIVPKSAEISEQQAGTYDEGYFYPGPAVKDVPLSMAPESSRQAIEEFGRAQYDKLIAGHPTETPLEAKAMVAAFHRWDEESGAAKLR